MSIEVEIKVKIQNRKQIMDSLKKIGFLENRCVVETDIYYTSTHHNFAALGEALRIRTVKDPESPKETSVITYKGAKLDQVSMTRQELETEVGRRNGQKNTGTYRFLSGISGREKTAVSQQR